MNDLKKFQAEWEIIWVAEAETLVSVHVGKLDVTETVEYQTKCVGVCVRGKGGSKHCVGVGHLSDIFCLLCQPSQFPESCSLSSLH